MSGVVLSISVTILFLIGLAGIVLPVIPSLPMIWLGILIYGLATGFSKITLAVIIGTGILMIIGSALDFLAGVFGAKISGASWYGVLGALVGSLVGFMIVNVLGLFAGAFIGAFVGEYLKYQKTPEALRAGFGTILGVVFGMVLKIIIAFMMIGIFIWQVF